MPDISEQKKNLCAQIPVSLHAKVRERQEVSGQTLHQYMTWLLTTFYEMEGRPMSDTRTLAVQIDAELFDRLDRYLKQRGLKKKPFLTALIQQALDEAENSAGKAEETPENE